MVMMRMNCYIVEFPTVLAQECNKRNIFLIHISSDYVFDGTKSPYHPSDPCCPINKVCPFTPVVTSMENRNGKQKRSSLIIVRIV